MRNKFRMCLDSVFVFKRLCVIHTLVGISRLVDAGVAILTKRMQRNFMCLMRDSCKHLLEPRCFIKKLKSSTCVCRPCRHTTCAGIFWRKVGNVYVNT
jgi:hypothetical protein